MLVYGDTPRHEDPALKLSALRLMLRGVTALPPGLARHSALVTAFIAASELAQGLADAEFARLGQDAPSPQRDAAMAMVMRLSAAVRVSWRSGFRDLPPPDELPALPGPLPDSIAAKQAEGFAFYALYPEAYLQAAAASGLPAATRVIGLRSIGLPLAALVATGLGAKPPITFRPVGHPFRRELALAPAMADMLHDAAPAYAIVDEGPGLSGSSFGAVADHLEDHGVAPGHLHLFPSHQGAPGAEASPRHQARWPLLHRHVVAFDALTLQTPCPPHRLTHWVADLTGPAEAAPQDVSGGGWRSLRYSAGDPWPPCNPWQERRKFLVTAGGARWLLKFTGLGEEASRKAALARDLAEAGFAPASAGLRHGFLVEPWQEGARGLDQTMLDPAALAGWVARYLGFRARHYRADAGASAEALWNMACHNTAQALGPDEARALRRQPPAAGLARRIAPCRVDGRMQAWEWLVLPSDSLRKTDALDHHAGHDLIGCQDIAWDIVGAAVELGVAPNSITSGLEAEAGRTVDPALLAFYTPCYLAFHLGAATMAAAGNGHLPEEAARLRKVAARYAGLLRRVIIGGAHRAWTGARED
jgi:hypothetical protein